MKQRTTENLYNALIRTDEIADYLNENKAALRDEMNLHEHLETLIESTGCTRADVIKRGELDPSYGYQLFRGVKHPSRETVIQLAFGFGLDVEEAQKLFARARTGALYARDRRDSVILFALNKHLTVSEANALLYTHGLRTIGNNE